MILSKKSLISAGSSAIAQLASFATSLVLTSAEGVAFYGELGLAFVTLLTLIFLLDLGFGLFFSREVGLGDRSWEKKWSLMLGLKLIAAIIISPILLGSWWWIYGQENIGTQYLCAAWPAIFISIFNFSPILYGLGRVKEASLPLFIVPGTYLIITIAAVNFGSKEYLPAILGMGYVISWLCQSLFYIKASSDVYRVKVIFSWAVMPLAVESFRVWRIALVGALYDRLGSFFVASVAPTFVAYYLLCEQGLQAIITLFMQAQKAHFPGLADLLEQKTNWDKVTIYCINFQIITILLFNTMGIIFYWFLYKVIALNNFHDTIFLYLFSGFLLICSAPLFTVLLLLRREGNIFKIVLLAHLITSILWFITLPLENLQLTIIIRALDAMLVWLGFLTYLRSYLNLGSVFLFVLGLGPLIGMYFPHLYHGWLIAPLIAILIAIAFAYKVNFKINGAD